MPIVSAWCEEVGPEAMAGCMEPMACECFLWQEDASLRQLVEQHGPKKWSLISSILGTKGSKQVSCKETRKALITMTQSFGVSSSLNSFVAQCRRRWKNYLNADLKKGGWSHEEDEILKQGHEIHGNKWTEIAKMVGLNISLVHAPNQLLPLSQSLEPAVQMSVVHLEPVINTVWKQTPNCSVPSSLTWFLVPSNSLF
jgi:hypothetical protein